MKKFIFLFAVSAALTGLAQEGGPITTDRPTQTPASTIMPAGKFLIETGFVREATASELTTYTIPNVLIRYGVNDFFEVRMQQDYLLLDQLAENESGFNSVKLGVKIKLGEEEGWKPQMSLLANLTTTSGQDPFKNQSISSDFSFVFSNTLSDKLSLGYSVGLINGEFGFDTSLYTLVLGYALTDGLTAFIEPYGFGVFDSGPSDHRINGGLIYLFKDNMQVDVSAGLGLSNTSPDSFAALGFSIGF